MADERPRRPYTLEEVLKGVVAKRESDRRAVPPRPTPSAPKPTPAPRPPAQLNVRVWNAVGVMLLIVCSIIIICFVAAVAFFCLIALNATPSQ